MGRSLDIAAAAATNRMPTNVRPSSPALLPFGRGEDTLMIRIFIPQDSRQSRRRDKVAAAVAVS